MKIELYKAYKTRGGQKAVVVSATGIRLYPWFAAYVNEAKFRSLAVSGLVDHFVESDFDLVEEWKEPLKGDFWLNIYPVGGVMANTSYSTKNEADMSYGASLGERLACVKVSWTEGDGL